jgi:hypothetical protein
MEKYNSIHTSIEWSCKKDEQDIDGKGKKYDNGVGIEQKFLEEVVDIACYLINQSPTSTLVDKTPHEAWIVKKPSLVHLKFFGCDAYVHVLKEKRSKLDNKAEKCIFIGYKDGVKGYKLWNLVIRKTVYSHDVILEKLKILPNMKMNQEKEN